MAVLVNDWEDGTSEGSFETVEEAKAYVLEEGLDVTICLETGGFFRFNAEVHEKEQVQMISEALKEKEIRVWPEEHYTETAKSLFRAGVRAVK